MKLAKILGSIMLVLVLAGCGVFKSQNPTTTNSPTTQSSSTQSEDALGQTPTASVDPTLSRVVSFSWIGLDQDVLSPKEIKQDGKADGHFHITVPFTQPAAIKSIWIRYSEFGKSLKWGWLYNINLPANGYSIAVLDNSGKVILPQGDTGYRVDGLIDFDLYLSELENENGRDTLKFAKGQTFELEIDYVTKTNDEKQYTSSLEID